MIPRSAFGVFRGGYIQVGERYFLRVLFGIDPEGLPDNGIVSRFGAVTVVKYQHSQGSAVVHFWDDGRCGCRRRGGDGLLF